MLKYGAERSHQKSDERILGDGDFVNQVLSKADEKLERCNALRAKGVDLEKIALDVAKLMKVKPEDDLAAANNYATVKTTELEL